jgi:hypothetical protein
MNRLLLISVLGVFVGTLFFALGCTKEKEVGYGGDVKTAPGGKAAEGPPGSKKGGGGLQVDPNN